MSEYSYVVSNTHQDMTPSEYLEWCKEKERGYKLLAENERIAAETLRLKRIQWAKEEEERQAERARLKEKERLAYIKKMKEYVKSDEFLNQLIDIQDMCMDYFFLHSCRGNCSICLIGKKYASRINQQKEYLD